MGKAEGGLSSTTPEAVAAAEHGQRQAHGATVRKAIALEEGPNILVLAHIARSGLHQDGGE